MVETKKHKGHYCKVCGKHKANEKFTGKGHAQHICKSCMQIGRKGITIAEDFKPAPVMRETVRFKNLKKEEKNVLKMLIAEVVTEYWQTHRRIPFSESLSELKNYIFETYDTECGILLKDEIEFKHYLQDCIVSTINKLLETENN